MRRVRLERDIERSLSLYPELIDDTLWGIRQGMQVLGPDLPTLKRQDQMPNGTRADLVFVEKVRITVVEIKRGALTLRGETDAGQDAVDQLAGYLGQCRFKYPERDEYRGIIVATSIPNLDALERKLSALPETITALVFGKSIPSVITFCRCGRAVPFQAVRCRCGCRCR